MNEVKTEPNCPRYKCWGSLVYKSFVVTLLLLIFYHTYLQKDQVNRDILVEELSSAQNNIISSLPDSTSSAANEGEKTVVEVLQELRSTKQDESIKDLRKVQKRLNDKDKNLTELTEKAYKYRKEINLALTSILDEKNIISEEDTEEENLADKGKKILSGFVQVRKIEDIQSDPKYLLKKEFIKLTDLLINKDYNSIASLYQKAGEVLEEKKYNDFAKDVEKFSDVYGKISADSEIEKLIKKVESNIAN